MQCCNVYKGEGVSIVVEYCVTGHDLEEGGMGGGLDCRCCLMTKVLLVFWQCSGADHTHSVVLGGLYKWFSWGMGSLPEGKS